MKIRFNIDKNRIDTITETVVGFCCVLLLISLKLMSSALHINFKVDDLGVLLLVSIL